MREVTTERRGLSCVKGRLHRLQQWQRSNIIYHWPHSSCTHSSSTIPHRPPSFLTSNRDLTESISRVVTAAVLEWCFGHLNALFANSPKQASNCCSIRSVTIQFSQPYRRTGTTQVSTTDLVDKGLRSPWKAPMHPKWKKVFLAFWMFSSTAREARRSPLHQQPRHFPSYPKWMGRPGDYWGAGMTVPLVLCSVMGPCQTVSRWRGAWSKVLFYHLHSFCWWWTLCWSNWRFQGLAFQWTTFIVCREIVMAVNVPIHEKNAICRIVASYLSPIKN